MQGIDIEAENKEILTRYRKLLRLAKPFLKDNDAEEVQNSLKEVNSIMAKAVKKGILKKQYMSRKLSSLSNHIKKN